MSFMQRVGEDRVIGYMESLAVHGSLELENAARPRLTRDRRLDGPRYAPSTATGDMVTFGGRRR